MQYSNELTPVEYIDGVYYKRDDKFKFSDGVGGSIGRYVIHYLYTYQRKIKDKQRRVVIDIEEFKEQESILEKAAELFNLRVIRKNEINDGHNFFDIDFNDSVCIDITRNQIKNLPLEKINRIVVDSDDVITFASILIGLQDWGWLDNPDNVCIGVTSGLGHGKQIDKITNGKIPYVELKREQNQSIEEYCKKNKILDNGILLWMK